MSTRFTIRMPQELKEKMVKNSANWSQEVRAFLEQRIKQMELITALEEIEKRSEKRKTKDSTLLIREERERRI
ncbi:MAG: hypothetical protein ABR909_09095 [Candidatus Bathyarchaeia archaeon]